MFTRTVIRFLSFNKDQSSNLLYFIIILYYNDILIGDYIQGWRLCIYYYHKRKPWHFDYIISCSVLIETLRKNCLSTFVRHLTLWKTYVIKLNELSHTAWTAIRFRADIAQWKKCAHGLQSLACVVYMYFQTGIKCVSLAAALRAEQRPWELIKDCISKIREQLVSQRGPE